MEWNCSISIAEIRWEKKLHLVCGNAIAEIGGKKFFLAIVAIPLLKMGRKKKWFLKSGKELKKNATSTIFLQHFHNKLQVIRYY